MRALSVADAYLNGLAACLMLAMMLLVTLDVAASYLFNSPLPGKLELTEFLMVGIVYGSLAYTQAVRGHINVEVVLVRLERRRRIASETLGALFALLFFALLFWRTTAMAWQSWEIREVTMGVEAFAVYPVKALIPLGSLLMCLRLLVDVADGLRALWWRAEG